MREMFELLFPPSCPNCGARGNRAHGDLCSACWNMVLPVCSPYCSICGREFYHEYVTDHLCNSCLVEKPAFSMARSISFYEDPVKPLLQRLKYNFDTCTIRPLRQIALSYDFSPFQDCHLVIPVPLHKCRLKRRGMNQSLLLSRIFFADHPMKIAVGILQRHRVTTSQTQLDARARKANVAAAFSVKDTDIVKNKVVCLVDDIYTTGTTVAECARTLRAAGAAEVKVLTMARARMPQ